MTGPTNGELRALNTARQLDGWKRQADAVVTKRAEYLRARGIANATEQERLDHEWQSTVAPVKTNAGAAGILLAECVADARRESAPVVLPHLLADPVRGNALLSLARQLPPRLLLEMAANGAPEIAAAARAAVMGSEDFAHASAVHEASAATLTSGAKAVRERLAKLLDQHAALMRTTDVAEFGEDGVLLNPEAMLVRANARQALLAGLGIDPHPAAQGKADAEAQRLVTEDPFDLLVRANNPRPPESDVDAGDDE